MVVSSTDHGRIVTLVIALALGMVIMLTAAAGSAEPVRIVLPTHATVDADTILLGEIADIHGADAEQVESLGAVEVGRAPLPGQTLLLHGSQVEMRLRQHRFDADMLHIEATGPVRVLRGHQSVTAEQITKAVHAFIVKHAPWSVEQMTIRPIQYAQSHRVPPGKVALQVIPSRHADWLGAMPFRVNIMVDGHAVQRTSVPAYIEVWQEVVLAAKPLGRNQPITRDDVKIETMNIARIPASAIMRLDQVLGRRANRPIAVNSVLRNDQVDLPPIIRRGDVVQVLAESETLRVTTQAVAQENGGLGETIRVMNMRSRKNIHAQVVDAQTVRVEF